MKLEKALRRERKIQRRRNGHISDSRSVFQIEEELRKRSLKIKQERERKELEKSGEYSY